MESLEILLALLIAVLAIRWLGWLRGIPIKKTTAGILALLLVGVGIYAYDWGGIKTWATDIAPKAEVIVPGVTYMALGSESDPNLLYDPNTKTFSATLVDNVTSQTLKFSTLTFTLTVYRTDTVSTGDKPPITKVEVVSVPTYQIVGDVQTYSPVALATTGEWDITITPEGGSALYERAYGTVPDGGSRSFTVTVNLNYVGVNKATDGTTYIAYFDAAGTRFTLSMVIGTAVT